MVAARWHRAAGSLALAPAVACTAVGALLGPDDVMWAPVWAAAALTYVWIAAALFAQRSHAAPGALGLALGGVAACVQGLVVVGPIPLLVAGLVGHAVWSATLLATPRELAPRHQLAVALATLALPCAAVYGLAPQQSTETAVWMLGSAATVWTAAVGISRDRTWGLLLAPLGALAVTVTVWSAPSCGCLENAHVLMPRGGLAVGLIGAAAAVLSAAVFVLYVGPMTRWLRATH